MSDLNKGTGALPSGYDIRDFHFNGMSAPEFDWNKGFDIEKVLGTTLTVKDQDGSGSCGGQAWAYYGEVLEALNTGNYEPRSARWIYSHTFNPYGGGSSGRDNCDHVIKKGWVKEEDATSYDNGKAPEEAFMRIKPKISATAQADAQVTKALSYLQVNPDIDTVAKALEANNGLIILIQGKDNGTWRSQLPKPPAPGEYTWRHWVYVGKAKTIKGKKMIGFINSWGDDTGKNGWQWIGEDYFNNGHVTEAWTLAWDYRAPLLKRALIEIIKRLKLMVNGK